MNPDHRIVRTKNRHSRAVLHGDIIVIRLARNLTEREERSHIESLLRRMREVALEERSKTLIDPLRPLLKSRSTFTLAPTFGLPCTFTLNPTQRGTTAKRTPEGWHVFVNATTNERTLHRFLWSLLSDFERDALSDLVDSVNRETLRVRIREVRCRFMRSQWGSCSRAGIISLNSALLFLPPKLLRYVIIHELAHRCIRSHSAHYWQLVERSFPTYKDARKDLFHYRLTSL